MGKRALWAAEVYARKKTTMQWGEDWVNTMEERAAMCRFLAACLGDDYELNALYFLHGGGAGPQIQVDKKGVFFTSFRAPLNDDGTLDELKKLEIINDRIQEQK